MKRLRGTLLLLLAAMIWGMAFVAQTAVSDGVGPFAYNAVRSLLGTLFLMMLLFIRGKRRKQTLREMLPDRRLWLGGALCGVALFAASNFQQGGIAAYPDDVAAAGRAGFITATYVVMVTVSSVFWGKKLRLRVWLAMLICVAGMYLLCISGGIDHIYLGDALVLLCAVGYTVQILLIDRFTKLDPLWLTCIQFATTAALSAVAMLIFETPSLAAIYDTRFSLLYTGILSSGVAFTLQTVGQKDAEPSVASIVMSLESVFAALAGWLILKEVLSPRELMGCALVFAAVIITSVGANTIEER